jgi:hypothetical protein
VKAHAKSSLYLVETGYNAVQDLLVLNFPCMSQQEVLEMYLLQNRDIIWICFVTNAAIRQQNSKYKGLNCLTGFSTLLNPIETIVLTRIGGLILSRRRRTTELRQICDRHELFIMKCGLCRPSVGV